MHQCQHQRDAGPTTVLHHFFLKPTSMNHGQCHSVFVSPKIIFIAANYNFTLRRQRDAGPAPVLHHYSVKVLVQGTIHKCYVLQ